ncbi:hypothetical protein HOA91_06080 [Candidatus Woesearchaeota archaeon]|jgi:hypothetical protein|nr:hypothetical protein [Candidatus Woesearchaeota archaeon]
MVRRIIHSTQSQEYGNRYSMYKVLSWVTIMFILWYSLSKISLFKEHAGWFALGFLVLLFVSDLSSNDKLKAYSKLVLSIPLFYVGYKILAFALEGYSKIDSDFGIFVSIFGFIIIGFAIFYVKKNKWVLGEKFGFRFNFRRLGSKKRIIVITLAIIGVVLLWNFFTAEDSDSFDSFDSFFDSETTLPELKNPEIIQTPEIVCNKPYIRFETNCCLDMNDNKICDDDELVITEIDKPQPIVEPLIVEGSKTEVIITNNQKKPVKLSVTYLISSKWFGKNSQETNIFDVDANSKQSFLVYDNTGCRNHPCSVGIISFTEIN